MKKLILIIIISLHASLFTVHPVTAQWGCTCLPEGITFTSQSQIDNFQTDYPGCTKILGSVIINPGWYNFVSDLNGLNVLTSIGGNLKIRNTYNEFTSLAGLDNLVSIGGNLQLESNYDLTTLSGLDQLNSIGGNLLIYINESLESLASLENVDSIGGNIEIWGNSALTSLAGLENIEPGSIINLSISGNSSLSSCEAQGICEYLTRPNGIVTIYDNAPGCNGPAEIAGGCGVTLPCLPYGNYYFYAQSEIDQFPISFPGCSVLQGNVKINGSDITNFNGLSSITAMEGEVIIEACDSLAGLENLNSIGGSLEIRCHCLVGLEGLDSIGNDLLVWTDFLTSMAGLNNLVYIGGNLIITFYDNSALNSLSGLDKLNFIGGDLIIENINSLESLNGLDSLSFIGGDLRIFDNDNLESLAGLEGLTTIEGSIGIYDNVALTSITSLEHLDPGLTENIYIAENPSLSLCEAQGICEYLANPNGEAEIYHNAPGCNGIAEVASGCGMTLSCLDFDHYYFYSQGEIDHFQTSFPDCTSLPGDVEIWGSDIINLYGLSNLVSIGGSMDIKYNDHLLDIGGLENLTSVAGDLLIEDNDSLTSLSGLENLTSIDGSLSIDHNNTLASLEGLENLTSVGGLDLYGNNSLISLSGLENLTSVDGSLSIDYNNALANLEGLENLTSVGGYLSIGYNNSLTSLSGLENLTSVGGLRISDNNALTGLEGLGNLSLIGGSVVITYNGSSNRDISENNSSFFVKKACPDLFEIHSRINEKDESIREGANVEILNNVGISGLECLFALNSIAGHLYIQGNDGLLNLSGFENITEIGGDVIIQYNNSLVDIEGLHNLNSIWGQLIIRSNDVLTDLNGLENLNSIGGMLKIYFNDNLSSLTGIDHIIAESISDLWIYNNYSLSTCEAQSICDYLALPDAVVYINNNAPGCDSEEEVEEACAGVGVDESAVGGQRSAVSVYPNPTDGIVDFRFSTVDGRWSMVNGQWISLKVYDVHGREVATVVDGGWSGDQVVKGSGGQVAKGSGGQVVRWDASGLPAGVYFYRLAVSSQRSAVGGQQSAVGGQRSAVGGQRSAVGGQRSAVGGKIVKY